jgi:hypothetical protein
MVTGSGSFISDTFVVVPQMRPQVGFDCPDLLHLFWADMPEADSFQVFALGQQGMELLATVPDTFAQVPSFAKNDTRYFAVAPVLDGVPGPRSLALDYTTQGVGCYFKNFLVTGIAEGKASFTAALGTTYGLAGARLERWEDGGYRAIVTQPDVFSPDLFFDDVALLNGANQFRLRLLREGGTEVTSDTLTVYHAANDPALVFPNPLRRGEALRLVTRADGTSLYRLYDMQGRLVLADELEKTALLDTSGLLPGCYLLRVSRPSGNVWAAQVLVF